MTVLYAVLAFVAVQRVAELAWAERNTARLRRAGAVEIDAEGYPFFVVMHGMWLAALLFVPAATPPSWPLLGLYALLQPLRLWAIASLGPYWTTRILTLPEAPLRRAGPYRWLRHPNYAVVTAEIALLPLAFGAIAVAAVFSALNLLLIARRIEIEDGALAPRRSL
ncbi:MAG TPA: isoprenylcysteine carboxylmethyltransferase family protein [Stellaceae bacterium]|jgi:methyltransferase